jgi:hypothetical protein
MYETISLVHANLSLLYYSMIKIDLGTSKLDYWKNLYSKRKTGRTWWLLYAMRWSLVILVVWCTWKERNLRVFQGQARSPATLVVAIAEEADRWSLAGFSQLAALWAGMTAWVQPYSCRAFIYLVISRLLVFLRFCLVQVTPWSALACLSHPRPILV